MLCFIGFSSAAVPSTAEINTPMDTLQLEKATRGV